VTEEEQHRTMVTETVNRDLSAKGNPYGNKKYRVLCSCGYISPWFDRKSHALYDENEHVIAMTR